MANASPLVKRFLPLPLGSYALTSIRAYATVRDSQSPLRLASSDRVFHRYKIKLEHRARELGLADISQLRETYQHQIAEFKRRDYIEICRQQDSVASQSYGTVHPVVQPPPPPLVEQYPSVSSSLKTLPAFLDLDKVRALGPKEIEAVWRLRHASSKCSLCATIPASTFDQMAETARIHPRFLLPLSMSATPRSADEKGRQALSLHFLEWTFPSPVAVTVMMTHLEEFKIRGDYAIPHTVVTHHLELAQEKGVVLLQGQVTADRGVSVDDARWLLMILQKFYSGIGEQAAPGSQQRSQRLLEAFTAGSEAFDLEELVREAGRIG